MVSKIFAVPAFSDPPFINPVFPPPGYTGPQEDPDHPHGPVEIPHHAILCGENGEAKIALTIAPDGHVPDAFVAQSSGFADLDAAALITVRQWRYVPATKDGNPVPVRITVTLTIAATEKPLPNFAQAVAGCSAAATQAAADDMLRKANLHP